MTTLFDVLYRCKDTLLVRIVRNNSVIYYGDVFTYRVHGIKYSCLNKEVIGIDIVPDLTAPVLVISLA